MKNEPCGWRPSCIWTLNFTRLQDVTTTLRTFINYSIITTNNVATQYHDYGAVVSDDNFWYNLKSCSCEFHVAFKYFKDFRNLNLKAATGGVLLKKVFLIISKYSWENSCAGAFYKATLLMETSARCFPKNIAKLLRTHVLKNICKRLLLSNWTFWKRNWRAIASLAIVTLTTAKAFRVAQCKQPLKFDLNFRFNSSYSFTEELKN